MKLIYYPMKRKLKNIYVKDNSLNKMILNNKIKKYFVKNEIKKKGNTKYYFN
jgi:hypothetical protein